MPCPQDDILLYARGLYGRHGLYAAALAADCAEGCATIGDNDGHEIWQQVSRAVKAMATAAE